jgi:hypothetical protein
MADIDVVPKRTTNLWLWIIAAIVLAVILFAFMGAFSGDSANRVGELMNGARVVALAGPLPAAMLS